MKTILTAVLISLVLVTVYTVLDAVVAMVYYRDPFFTESPIYFPLRLPRTVYTMVAPDFIQDAAVQSPLGSLAERLAFFAANVVLYTIPTLAALQIFVRRKKTVA